MPPVRTMAPSRMVQKTERTHEENQERAYIAASRRSDRSLEARIESARRASEIHKKRTGKALRVRQEDVENEDMYEEEDDDLPAQYRRLTAHLQTDNEDFNRRLSAYLATNVAMRAALERTIQNSYNQQTSNTNLNQNQEAFGMAPPFPNSQYAMYPSPMLTHQQQQQPSMSSPLIQSPSLPSSVYRKAPYPSPKIQTSAFRNVSPHQNTGQNSPATELSHLANLQTATEPSDNMAKVLMASATDSARSPVSAPTPSPARTASQPTPSFPTAGVNPLYAQLQTPPYNTTTFGPLSTALPADAQSFLSGPGGGFNVGNTDMPTISNCQSMPTPSSKTEQLYSSYEGLNSVLYSSTYDDNDFFNDTFHAGSHSDTPAGSPAENWTGFLESDFFDQLPAS